LYTEIAERTENAEKRREEKRREEKRREKKKIEANTRQYSKIEDQEKRSDDTR
jgi:hypothetical protein